MKGLTRATGVLLALGLLSWQAVAATRANSFPEPFEPTQIGTATAAVRLLPKKARLPVVQLRLSREFTNDFDDAPADGSKLPLDLASEAGTAAGFAATCGSDPAPVWSAFKAMLRSLQLDRDTELRLSQRYHSAASSTVATLSSGRSTLCHNVGNTLKSAIRDLSMPAS